MPDPVDKAKEDIQKLAAQNEAASKHWDKAVRYHRVINRLKDERNSARKEVKRLKAKVAELEHKINRYLSFLET